MYWIQIQTWNAMSLGKCGKGIAKSHGRWPIFWLLLRACPKGDVQGSPDIHIHRHDKDRRQHLSTMNRCCL